MTFPQTPLDLRVELDLGTWTDISADVYQREGTSPPVTITRGRASEQSSASPTAVSMQWNNRSGKYSPRLPTGPYYGLLGRNTPVRLSVPAAVNYLRMADDQASGASCPGSGPLTMTGDIDIRIDLSLDNWEPCFLAGQWTGLSAKVWALTLNGDGTVTFTWNDGVTVNAVTSTMPLPLGRVMIRCLFDPAGTFTADQVVFYTAANMGAPQSRLGEAFTIGAADFAAGVSTPLLIGYSGQWAADFDAGGMQGAVYEVQAYSAGVLRADPVFSAQSSAPFTDGQGNTWTVSGSAEISSRNYRAHAECTTLPQRWDPSGNDVWTPVAASGILRRIQQGSAPLPSPMRRFVTQAARNFYWDTLAYYPCEDLQGSTQIASGLPGGQAMMFAGSPGFQGTAGSLSADSQFACSAQLAQVQSSTWTSPPLPTSPTIATSPAELWFLLSIPAGTAGQFLVSLWPLALAWTTSGGGGLELFAENTTGPTFISVPTGTPLLVGLYTTSTGATLTVIPANNPQAPQQATLAFASLPAFSGSLVVNPNGANLGATEIGHLLSVSYVTGGYSGPDSAPLCSSAYSVPAAAPPAAMSNALAAHNGETAGNRFLRLCQENGIPGRVYGYPDLTMAMGLQPIDTLANNLQYCEDADRGLIYEPAEVLALGYRTLGSLCGQSPAVTLDYSAAGLGGTGQDLEPEDDDQFTLNDVTAQRNNGSSVQVQVTTGNMSINAPPDGVGDYSTSVTLYNAWDKDLANIAGWMAWAGTTDEERYPVIPLNLARSQLAALLAALMGLRQGDFVEIVNMPAWMPPGAVKQLHYGSAEPLGAFFWQLALNAVPESPFEVAAASAARADTAGSELDTSYSSGATLLQVDVTAGNFWTTSASDFPFDIKAGGERMTVTNIDGPAPNFLTGDNAQFEAGNGNWAPGLLCAVTHSTAQAHSGSGSMLLTATGAGTMTAVMCGAGSLATQGLACSPGDLINGAKWFRAGTVGRPCLVQVGFYTAGLSLISTASGTTVTDQVTGWVKAVIFQAAAPATSAWCRLIDAVQSVAGAGEQHFTDDGYIANATTGAAAGQSFTVTRSVNGVVKPQSSGIAVNVYTPPVAGLAGNH